MQRTLIFLALSLLASASTCARASEGVSVDTPEAQVEVRTDGTISVAVDEAVVNGAGAKYRESQRAGVTWVTFENNGQFGTFDCQKRHVSISGKGSQLVLQGECPFIEVSGDSNQVTIESAGEISVAGDGNMITWQKGAGKAKAQVSDSGKNNQIVGG